MKFNVNFCTWNSGSVVIEAKSELEAREEFLTKAKTYHDLYNNYNIEWIDGDVDLKAIEISEGDVSNAIRYAVPGNLMFATHICNSPRLIERVKEEAKEEFGDEVDELDLRVAAGNVLAKIVDSYFNCGEK